MGWGWEQREGWGELQTEYPVPWGGRKLELEGRLKLASGLAHLGLTATSTPRLTTPPPPRGSTGGPFQTCPWICVYIRPVIWCRAASKQQFLRQNTETWLEACGQFVPVFSI